MQALTVFLLVLSLFLFTAAVYLNAIKQKGWEWFIILGVLLIATSIYVQREYELGKKKEADRVFDLIKEFRTKRKDR